MIVELLCAVAHDRPAVCDVDQVGFCTFAAAAALPLLGSRCWAIKRNEATADARKNERNTSFGSADGMRMAQHELGGAILLSFLRISRRRRRHRHRATVVYRASRATTSAARFEIPDEQSPSRH